MMRASSDTKGAATVATREFRDATLASSVGEAELERLHPPDGTSRLRLDPAHGEYMLGRSRQSDIVLVTPTASRLHARLRWTSSAWVLTPMSSHGVLLDDTVVTSPVVLAGGARVSFGHDVFRFHCRPLPAQSVLASDESRHAAAESERRRGAVEEARLVAAHERSAAADHDGAQWAETAFARAEACLAEAHRWRAEGASDEALRRYREAEVQFRRAREEAAALRAAAERRAETLGGDAIQARARACAARADVRCAELWRKIEAEHELARSDFDAGACQRAAEGFGKLIDDYEAIERLARHDTEVEHARALKARAAMLGVRREAERRGALRVASHAWEAAEGLSRQAHQLLASGEGFEALHAFADAERAFAAAARDAREAQACDEGRAQALAAREAACRAGAAGNGDSEDDAAVGADSATGPRKLFLDAEARMRHADGLVAAQHVPEALAAFGTAKRAFRAAEAHALGEAARAGVERAKCECAPTRDGRADASPGVDLGSAPRAGLVDAFPEATALVARGDPEPDAVVFAAQDAAERDVREEEDRASSRAMHGAVLDARHSAEDARAAAAAAEAPRWAATEHHRATVMFAQAERVLERGDLPRAVERFREAGQRFAKSLESADAARRHLLELIDQVRDRALQARESARAAGALDRFASEWSRAEAQLGEADREASAGGLERADELLAAVRRSFDSLQQRARAALESERKLTLELREAMLLARATAHEQGAMRDAPRSWEAAERVSLRAHELLASGDPRQAGAAFEEAARSFAAAGQRARGIAAALELEQRVLVAAKLARAAGAWPAGRGDPAFADLGPNEPPSNRAFAAAAIGVSEAEKALEGEDSDVACRKLEAALDAYRAAEAYALAEAERACAEQMRAEAEAALRAAREARAAAGLSPGADEAHGFAVASLAEADRSLAEGDSVLARQSYREAARRFAEALRSARDVQCEDPAIPAGERAEKDAVARRDAYAEHGAMPARQRVPPQIARRLIVALSVVVVVASGTILRRMRSDAPPEVTTAPATPATSSAAPVDPLADIQRRLESPSPEVLGGPLPDSARLVRRPVVFHGETFYSNSLAVLVGINRYASRDVRPLRYAEADVTLMASALARVGFPAENIFELRGSQATLRNMKGILGSWLRNVAQRTDRLFVFFSGHGFSLDLPGGGDDDVEGFLMAYDSDPNDLPGTALSMNEFRQIRERLAPAHLFFVIDACHSGWVKRGTRSVSPPSPASLDMTYLLRRVRKPVAQVLTAGMTDEEAVEQNGNGIFTRKLVEGFGGDAATPLEPAPADQNRDGVIEGGELAAYLQTKIPAITNGQQHPEWEDSFDGGDGMFLFFTRP